MNQRELIYCPCTVETGALRLFIRPVESSDKEALREGFEELSQTSRYFRFLTPVNELSERLVRYLTEIDHDRHVAWLAALLEKEGLHPIGVARHVRDTSENAEAEMAITIVDAHQRQGVGSLLFYVMCESAASRGLTTLSAVVHNDNEPMRRFLATFDATPGKREVNAQYFRVDVNAALARLEGKFELRPIADGRFAGVRRQL